MLRPQTLISLTLSQACLVACTARDEPIPASVAVHRLEEGASQWTRADAGLPDGAVLNGWLLLDNRVIAVTERHGVFRGELPAVSWTASSQGLPPETAFAAIAVHGRRLFLGGSYGGLFLSDDGGETWSRAEQTPGDGPIRGFFSFQSALYAATNTGIHASEDQGATWQHRFGSTQVNGFATLGGDLYAAMLGGVARSSDGREWILIREEGTLHNISSDGTYVFAMEYTPRVVRSRDRGVTWEAADRGLPSLYTFQVIARDGAHYAAQWDGVYRSRDAGLTWEKWSGGLPAGSAITELLVTPQGVLAAGVPEKRRR